MSETNSKTNTKLISSRAAVQVVKSSHPYHLIHQRNQHKHQRHTQPELELEQQQERPRKMMRRTEAEAETEVETEGTNSARTSRTEKNISDCPCISSSSREIEECSTFTSSLSSTHASTSASACAIDTATPEATRTDPTNTSTATFGTSSREDDDVVSDFDSGRRVKRIDRKASLELTKTLPNKERVHNSNNYDNSNDNNGHYVKGDEGAQETNSDLILNLASTTPELNQEDPSPSLSSLLFTPTLPESLSLEPQQCSSDMSPDTYLHQLFEHILSFQPFIQQPNKADVQVPVQIRVRPTLEVSPLCCYSNDPHRPFLPPITEDELANYDSEVVNAVREGDIGVVKAIHSNKGDASLSCCNRFGESLLHMACRRGYDAIVHFLVQSANVSVRITDDCGRTPLHDALWNRECQYGIMDLLVRTDPILLLTCDKRGHTPFAYARREHWANWRQFLWDRREHMRRAMNAAEVRLFCKSLS
mmetsp:Transcript_23174/g.34498  ORF Transcript_23174/g.34498 Transcript_23174/m.34498 type:complete len:477 (-) Transcript_23174:995-2425(-)|eukprot:CAMPEP_0203686384 /NCGR_PEP_ID=MMETSP0090-20130426/49031_1 /ASSEMBLY_ACC=CAM_ASM_001088 /TAXON_ID=426623 /ORGANISM="Chaetoceros affinis, Strain CCMP159" /LENGTH=476 /DNA_ID=CAMNT_0050555605 /DNA_START=294 /DNA_END=1724 /DNA_ORIENTATION=+